MINFFPSNKGRRTLSNHQNTYLSSNIKKIDIKFKNEETTFSFVTYGVAIYMLERKTSSEKD